MPFRLIRILVLTSCQDDNVPHRIFVSTKTAYIMSQLTEETAADRIEHSTYCVQISVSSTGFRFHAA